MAEPVRNLRRFMLYASLPGSCDLFDNENPLAEAGLEWLLLLALDCPVRRLPAERVISCGPSETAFLQNVKQFDDNVLFVLCTEINNHSPQYDDAMDDKLSIIRNYAKQNDLKQ